MPSLLDDDLDLSTLDNFNLNQSQVQDQNQKDKKETKTDIDLSVLDDVFPKEAQPLKEAPAKITSKFGTREDPFGLGKRFHNGVDIPMKLNTPVSSLGRGIVISVGDDGGKNYGKHVVVDYGGGLQLTYGHLNKIGVEVGDKVTSDALVGVSGSTGRSKGPHLHIKAMLNGKPVNPEDYFGSIHDVALGALSGDDVVEKAKLDLSVLDNLSEQDVKKEANKDQLDLSPLDTMGEFAAKPIEEAALIDKDVKEYSEYLARGGAAFSQPKLSVKSPDEFVGNPIRTSINTLYDPTRPNLKGAGLRPNENQVVDAWLGALDPSYVQLNTEYRAKTGRNIVQLDPSRAVTYEGNSKWGIKGRLTYGAKELINTYIEARKKGGVDAGVEAVYFKNQQLDRQAKIVADEITAAKTMNKDTFAQRHPYMQTFFNVILPATILNNEREGVKSGLGNFGIQEAQMFHNLRMLPEAIYKLYRYGGDSEEYTQLIERDQEIQNRLYGYASEVYQPQTLSGKITSGVVTGALSLPKYMALGSAGLPTLPTLVYLENIHRGNPEAVKQALTMAVLVGATHGFGEFLNSGTKAYITETAKDGTQYIRQVEVGRGLGNRAPFSRIRDILNNEGFNNSLSISQPEAVFLANSPSSIGSLSSIERQLIMRGTNAFSQSGLSLLGGESAQDAAANFIVGLSFPVGKNAKGSYEEGKFGLIPYIPEQAKVEPRKSLLAQPRIQVESNGSTLFLSLDDAALNLLDLRRALKDPNSYIYNGLSLKEKVSRQISIQKAINALASQIPADTLDYFEKNEGLIRSAIKTNYDAVKAKEEYLGRVESTEEFNNISDIKENPSIDLKESPIQRLTRAINRTTEVGKRVDLKENPEVAKEIAKDVFGNDGEQNTWQTPDRTLLAFDRLLNYKGKSGNTLRSGLDLAAIGKDIVEGGKAVVDLTQISAFYLEDFYHRKVEPSVTELANKFRIALGDIVKGFSDKDFQTLFEKGKEYLDSNVADPFFSSMKQDVVEKMPNRLAADQAVNFLSKYEKEFEWTVGLKEFIEDRIARNRPVYRENVIDIINRGQVKVEAAIASDVEYNKATARIKEIRSILKNLNTTNEKELIQYKNLHKELNQLQQVQHSEYGPQFYSGELLELPGGNNTTKEVKLISPIPLERPKSFVEFLQGKNLTIEQYDALPSEQRAKIIDAYNPVGVPKNADLNILYKSPHWDEANVVAHYNTTDRITTDNQKVYFGEEFQSDWNHDIREKGLSVNENNYERYGYKIERKSYNNPYKVDLWTLNDPQGVEVSSITDTDVAGNKISIEQAKPYLFNSPTARKGIEPNPFMQHNWKELVLKRFLRDAAIAKDENGNYKYDGIGWTTARQQLERYGGILEGKEFKWRKNSNGTYSFDMKNTDPELPGVQWQNFHELNNITLERFAELTTPEAAQEVRDQEAKWIRPSENVFNYHLAQPSGQFSLKEAVELRAGGMDKYGDYDVAYKNILNKIGKRFGAKYSEKEIPTVETKLTGTAGTLDYNLVEAALDAGREVYGKNRSEKGDAKWELITSKSEIYKYNRFRMDKPKLEKIHYLEITPSMRFSLEKEGLPLYGTGGSESLKSPEVGVRNKLVTFDAFNQAREDLVKRLSNEDLDASEHKGTTFNSGLNPEAFIDQAKLLYGGIKDLVEFTKALSDRYGSYIERFAEDLYWSIRNKANDFNNRLNIKIDNWQENLNKVADNPAWQIRNSDKGERGSFSLRRKTSPELEDYFNDKEKHQIAIGLDYRAWLRGIALSQLSTEFGKVYDTMRAIQRVVSSYETKSLNRLMLAKKTIKLGLDKPIADAIYAGNEWINPATGNREGKVWSDPELATNFGLNSRQIQAYKDIRYAIDNVLNLRLENKLYSIRESSKKLTDKLATLTVGTPEYDAVANKILDLADLQTKTIAHYNELKDSGYISLQRKGKIAAFIEDPSLPVGDPNRKIYNQFDSLSKANKWIQQQKAALGLPSTYKGSLYDIRNLRDIVLKEKLTPSQFEDLVDRSSASSTDPQIEKLREEVYSKFPSFTYQLKREFVRGYDRDLQTAINSTVDQLELYASSFYSKVGREEGLKQLEATGIEKTDPNLYRIANSYINDETAPAELNWLSKGAIKARRFTYLWQLGFDVNQLWLNAVAQPITQTYGYFYRVADPLGTGKQLTGLEPEHFFIKAGKQVGDFYRGKTSVEFNDIVNRLKGEKVLSPEFTKTFIEAETGSGKTSKLENWASIFMRTGEHLTRLHAASEAYLVGKEKFHLTGEDLVSFIVKSVDATQSNPTRGENPFVIRQLGEGGKLFYQFMAFNQMWWENLALGVKNNEGISRKGLFLTRELAPLAIMGGLTGMPLAGFAGTLYTLITNKDPKKEMDKYLGDDTLIEQAARYGITTSAAISQKATPSAPILDQAGRILTTDENNIEDLAANAPAVATGNQIWNMRKIVSGDNKLKRVINALPRSLKGPANAIYTYNEGYKAGETTLLSRRKITPLQTAGQIINITPTPVIEKFDQQRTKKLKKFRRSLKRAI